MTWKKSTRSYTQETCVEANARWRTASATGQTCVEVASAPDTVWVRDSKDTDRGMFAVSGGAWQAFIGGLC